MIAVTIACFPRLFLACVAGGIVGARSKYKSPPHAPRGFPLLAAPPPKLYFARAYTIPPASQASWFFVLH